MAQTATLMALADVPLGRGAHWRGHGLELAVFRVGDEVFAIADSCQHQGAALSNGKLQGYLVACPAHGLKFDVRTGCSQVSPDLRNQRYPVRVVDGKVVLDIE